MHTGAVIGKTVLYFFLLDNTLYPANAAIATPPTIKAVFIPEDELGGSSTIAVDGVGVVGAVGVGVVGAVT